MADLVVLGYPDRATAKAVYVKVEELQKDDIIDGTAAVLDRSTDGGIQVEAPTGGVGAGAASGALWGGLFGLLLFIPIGGLIVGGILGALMGKLADSGIDDEFRARVQEILKPGTSAVVIIFSKATPDRALAALAPYGGEVLQTSLSKDVEAEITRFISGGTAEPTPPAPAASAPAG
jgi:uncharacterized membrane protein